MAFKLVLMVVVLLISAAIYSLVKNLGINIILEPKNNSECFLHSLPMPTEDIAVFKHFFIGATTDFLDISFKHRSSHTIKPGFLISIEPKSMKISKIPMKQFPPEFQMNSHGFKVFKDTLYVLSHSYTKGGERIFVFDLELVDGEVEATYKESYHFPGEDGQYNSVAFVDEKSFFISQWMPFPDEPEGKDNTFFGGMYRILKSMYFKVNTVKFCKITEKSKVSCEVKTYGHMFNGILYQDGTLFVGDSLDRTVNVYKVGNNFDLELVQKIELKVVPDNIWFSNEQGYITGMIRAIDFIKLGDAVKYGKPLPRLPGGTQRFYLKNGTWEIEEVVMQDKLDLPTAAVVTDRVYMVSVVQSDILVCPLIR